MSDAIRNAIAELRKEAASLRAKADAHDQAAERLEALVGDQAPAAAQVARPQPRKSRAGQDSKPKAEPKPAAVAAKIGDWTAEEEARMTSLRAAGHTWGEIGRQLGRTESACIQRDFRRREAADKAREAKLNGAQA